MRAWGGEEEPVFPDVVQDAWRALGRQLAGLRKRAGYTQHTFAPLTSYGRSTVANAESGSQRVARGFWARCDELLLADSRMARRYDEILAMEQGLQRLRVMESEPPARRGIERRSALLAGITAVAAASGLVGRATAARQLGGADVARIRAVTALYRSLDYEVGGGAIRRDVNRFAHTVTQLLDHGDAAAVREPLLTAVAEARQLAGWTAFDAGRHADAQRHLLAAERAAVAGGDLRLAARVRYCQARQFQYLRHNRDAVDALRLARDHLGAHSTPAITAMIDGLEASSLADLGDHDAAARRLASATDAFERIEPAREPAWMNFYDHGELLAQYGRVYRDMARHDAAHARQAVRWTTDAIGELGPQKLRSTVLNEIGLCSALFLADEPEEAVEVGHRLLGHAKEVNSARVVERIRNLRRDFGRHAKDPGVGALSLAIVTFRP
jgi:tetratricopeptide (TPR) repeat protein